MHWRLVESFDAGGARHAANRLQIAAVSVSGQPQFVVDTPSGLGAGGGDLDRRDRGSARNPESGGDRWFPGGAGASDSHNL